MPSAVTVFCATALVAALAACGAAGDGIAPVSATIQPRGGLEGAASTRIYSCLNSALTFILTFSDGQRGDFTARARYTSSNPNVVKVSNADIPVAENTTGLVYSAGVLVPVSTGTATITATYLSFTRTIDVSVGTLDNLRVVPSSASAAPATLVDFALVGDLDGQATPLDAAAQWAFVSPNDAIATINIDSGTVTGVATGSGLTARAHIPGCAQTADAALDVSPLQSLALSREFGSNDKLVVGTTEAISSIGTLANGKTQDLSFQSTYTSDNTAGLSLVLTNLALATAASNPVNITATVGSTGITSPALTITPVADTLAKVDATPVNASVKAGFNQQFVATGTYASGLMQPITRHVGWTLSDLTLASIATSTSSSINASAGFFTAASTAGGKTVMVTATNTSATAQPVSTVTVNIQ